MIQLVATVIHVSVEVLIPLAVGEVIQPNNYASTADRAPVLIPLTVGEVIQQSS